jgi:CubicO group peptidase (beta-lactamase class C family)
MASLSWDLAAALKAAIAKNKVPAASVAVFQNETLSEAAHGLLNVETGVEATVDALFHIASITKPMTATIAMQLVEEGRLDLTAPVQKYLADFTAADARAAAAITVRDLMTHASGIDGDFFLETSRGEDRVAKLLEAGKCLPQLHAVREGISYNNYAFCVLGRIIEVLDGCDFDTVWRTRISERLNTPSLLTLKEDALRYRVAVGHSGGPDGWKMPRAMYLAGSSGPAGGTAMARARDLISFGLMHLNEGVTREGRRVLSAATVRAMQEMQNPLPADHLATGFGLAWMRFDWGGTYLFGHDGASIFQRSFLRIFPERRTIVALLCNGGDAAGLFRDVAGPVFAEAGAPIPPVPAPNGSIKFDPKAYVGAYRRRSARLDVTEGEGGLMLTSEWTDAWAAELYGKQGPFPLKPGAADRFLWCVPGLAEPGIMHFQNRGPDGRWNSLHSGFRINHRVS